MPLALPRSARLLAAGALCAVGAPLLLAGPASAHVTVNSASAAKGGFAKLAFRVPTESETASTTKVEVTFPAGQPLAFVSVRPNGAWVPTVEKAKLATPIKTEGGEVTEAVSKITWTGGSIKPGEFDEFEVSAGPLPTTVDELVFKAVQTYSDGSVVRWIDEETPGGAEPEHPAPTLHLTAASASGDHHDAAATPETTKAGTTVSAEAASATHAEGGHDSEGLAIAGVVLGGTGLVLGAAGLAVASTTRKRLGDEG